MKLQINVFHGQRGERKGEWKGEGPSLDHFLLASAGDAATEDQGKQDSDNLKCF